MTQIFTFWFLLKNDVENQKPISKKTSRLEELHSCQKTENIKFAETCAEINTSERQLKSRDESPQGISGQAQQLNSKKL